ncbi:uncharacterized protein LOC119551458 [Drosophila subpulchrella]|uniref:uncharacterized protein LOC119551458 n=1 Tax=Drosophila subpulchrella TaxID=1486046 RepID=UPI0018A19E35|nr:uncharacterized protein LOC119551458 [Drosophila subpulchrella]
MADGALLLALRKINNGYCSIADNVEGEPRRYRPNVCDIPRQVQPHTLANCDPYPKLDSAATLHANKANRVACDLSVYVNCRTKWRICCYLLCRMSTHCMADDQSSIKGSRSMFGALSELFGSNTLPI